MSQLTDSEEWDFLNEEIRVRYAEELKNAAICTVRRYLKMEDCDLKLNSDLNSIKRGVFVTIKNGTELRGCIGFIDPPGGLMESVERATLLAATEDPRFMPVLPDEIDAVSFEITVLGPLTEVNALSDTGLDAISLGRHGLMIESKFGRGVLLPQVAIEWGFTKLEFLEATCLKAGLSRDSWKEKDTRIYSFNAVNL